VRFVIIKERTVLLLLIPISIIFTFSILLAGCSMNKQQHYDDKTIQIAKEKVESYIRNNYENIDTIEFDNDDYSSPMGGMMIDGTVNGKAGFSADIDPKSFRIGSMGLKKGFPERKEECKKETCDY